MAGVAPLLPEIDGERCVHALQPHAGCRACVEACPTGAWHLDDEGLGLETGACTGCGLCVPACPRAAVEMSRPVEVLFDAAGKGTAFAACSQAAPASPLMCLHALGTRDLDRLADENVTQISVASGDCAACTMGVASGAVFAAADLHQKVRISQGKSALGLVRRTPPEQARALARALEDQDRVDRGRRRLFGAFLGAGATGGGDQPTGGPALAYWTPQMDATRCVGCDACVRTCPDGALTLEPAPDQAYKLSPVHCSGCRLCVDICDQSAISVTAGGPANNQFVRLEPFRCRACGAPDHRPVAAPGTADGLCRICARTGHYKKLYQVFRDT